MTDDQLLERLSAALVPVAAPAVPPAVSLQDLHREIDATTRTGAKAQPRRPGPRVLTIGVAASVAAACVAIVMVATSLPRISRETATRISVTATSPALGEVTDRRRALETALADGDTAAVAVAAARLRVALNDLATSEWIPIRAEIEDLLGRADALLERSGRGGNEDSPGGSPNASSTTQPGVRPVVTQPTGSTQANSTQASSTQATSPAPPPPTVTAATGPTSPSTTVADDEDDNSGPGNGADSGDADDNSGPGGGDSGDDDSGPGSD